jgi:hypothetical protein
MEDLKLKLQQLHERVDFKRPNKYRRKRLKNAFNAFIQILGYDIF